MKKILFIFFASMLLLVGCGKKGIYGTWKTESGTYKYTFNEDGTCIQEILGSQMSYNCIYDDEKITFMYEKTNSDSVAFTFYYTLNGNVLNVVEKSEGLPDRNNTLYRK